MGISLYFKFELNMCIGIFMKLANVNIHALVLLIVDVDSFEFTKYTAIKGPATLATTDNKPAINPTM